MRGSTDEPLTLQRRSRNAPQNNWVCIRCDYRRHDAWRSGYRKIGTTIAAVLSCRPQGGHPGCDHRRRLFDRSLNKDFVFASLLLRLPSTKRGGSPRSEYENNVVTLCARERCTDGAGLTEFEALDALPPFDDSGKVAWAFEGEPTTRREKRWLELYAKKGC
jgi:hypothetical protein